MSGIIHSYYAVVLAPAIGALVGAGVVELWRLRARSAVAGLVLAAGVLAAAVWAAVLLNRTPGFLPGIDIVVVMVALAAAVVIAWPEFRRFPRISRAAAALGLMALLVGPSAYALGTMNTAFAGGDPSAVLVAGTATGPVDRVDPADPADPVDPADPGRTATSTTSQALSDYLTANRGTAYGRSRSRVPSRQPRSSSPRASP